MTWGQFFVYQGFNENAGWMHTSSGADNIDEFLETIVERDDGQLFYVYGEEERPVETRAGLGTVPHPTDGGMASSARSRSTGRTTARSFGRSATSGSRWL